MASNSVQLDCAKRAKAWTLSVNWSESDTNIANNTTKITASGTLASSNTGFNALYDSYACHLRLYWHDNNTNKDVLFGDTAFTTAGVGQGGNRTVKGSATVTHKSDGSLSGYVKVEFYAPTTSGGFSPSSSSCSAGWTTCTTIARASSISGLSGNQLGSGVSVTIDRKSTSFTHKVEYKFVNSGWTTVSSNAATSCSFTPPVSLASQIPSAISGALTVRVTTYNGSTQIGDAVTNSINLNVPSNIVPSLSGLSATRIDNSVPSSWGVYVKGISQVKITASGASGSYGSTIIGYSISGPGLYTNSSSGTSAQLSSTGTLTYTCTVTDSRGRTASKSVSITVVDYTYPNISMSVERCTSDGTKSTNGTYLRIVINYSIASVSGKNGLYSKSCSCNGVSSSSFASGTAFVLAANCSIGNHYVVNASIRDNVGNTATASADVATAYRVLNVNKNKDGLAIGKFSEKAAFEVNMDSHFYGDITIPPNVSKLDESVPVAGDVSSVVTNVKTTANAKSVLGSAVMDGNWYSLISARHRNGAIDGGSYGMYLRSDLIRGGDLFWGKQHGLNAWQPERRIVDNWNITDMIFPVGAIYITYNNNNPGNFLGGTWEQFGQGRMLAGQGSTVDQNGYTIVHNEGETWGATKHKLTKNESFVYNDVGNGGSMGAWMGGYTWANTGKNVNLIRPTWDPEEFYILPPYTTVYFWRRTA